MNCVANRNQQHDKLNCLHIHNILIQIVCVINWPHVSLGVSDDSLQLSDVLGFERRKIFRFSETLGTRSFTGSHRKYCVNM